MEIKFVEIDDAGLCALVGQLDQYFHQQWGAVAGNYTQHHDLSKMACAAVAYVDDAPVGCGCWKPYDAVTAELKRIFVLPEKRRMGVAGALFDALERHAIGCGCRHAVLETGAEMPEAIAFFQARGYCIIPNYGMFVDDPICICLGKELDE